jgi:hypothetical protein
VAAAYNLERVTDTSSDPQPRATLPEQRREDQQLDDAAWSVSAVESRTIETTEAFVRIAWKVTIKNGIGRAQGFDFVVQFLDPDGTVVDTAHVGGEMVAASGERTITGEKQIPAPAGLRPLHIKAVANRKTR